MLFILFFVSLFAVFKVNGNSEKLAMRIDSLLNSNEIFKAGRLYEKTKQHLSQFDSLRFAARLDYLFNKPEASIEAVSVLMKTYSEKLNKQTKFELLKLTQRNFVRHYQYEDAARVTGDILEKYASCTDSAERADFENELNIWSILKNEPPQVVSQKSHSIINLVDGFKLPVSVNNKDEAMHFLFDTGANISIVIQSVADKTEMKFFGNTCKVKGILGDEVETRIALAEKIEFGNTEVENVVFLVFPDSALYFKQAGFQINGILGYPVIAALNEIHYTRDRKIIIPSRPTKNHHSNLALKYLTPVVEVISNGDSLVFTLDSGAGKKWLYRKYFAKNKEQIVTNHQKQDISLAGIGGANIFSGYYTDFPFRINRAEVVLDSAIVIPESINPTHEKYYGNIGQDAIGLFHKTILNFIEMFVLFSNE